jgi:hypothetical protein
LLIEETRKPIKIRTGKRKIDKLIPRRGTDSPEKMMNPIAEPARSALYTCEEFESVIPGKVNCRKKLPVIAAGKNPDRINNPATIN